MAPSDCLIQRTSPDGRLALRLDPASPDNAAILAHLRSRRPDAELLSLPWEHPTAHLTLGSHPDVVARVWEGLTAGLPWNCQAVVLGTPALVHGESGVILALAYGTAYALRLPSARLEQALQAGCRASQKWAGGTVTNTRETFGPLWLFGGWSALEPGWLLEASRELAP